MKKTARSKELMQRKSSTSSWTTITRSSCFRVDDALVELFPAILSRHIKLIKRFHVLSSGPSPSGFVKSSGLTRHVGPAGLCASSNRILKVVSGTRRTHILEHWTNVDVIAHDHLSPYSIWLDTLLQKKSFWLLHLFSLLRKKFWLACLHQAVKHGGLQP